MKTIRGRGMRDIPTIQGLRHRSLPGTREQTIAEVARLEHEKARLQRELSIWLANQERTEKRIRQVEQRLAALQDVLDPLSTGRRKRTQACRSQDESTDENRDQEWEEITLEY